MKYDLITCDAPWTYQNWTDKKNGAVKAHYKTLKVEDLCQLPIEKIAKDNSILLQWATFPKLQEAMEVMEAWGFKYITCAFVWNKVYCSGKPYCGLGFYSRSGTEICLLGKKGKGLPIKSKGVRQVITAPVVKPHSTKPNDEIRKRIGELFGTNLKKIELFARPPIVKGWDAIGFEVDGKDIKDSLQGIIKK
jgi:site-specific DNA-methyltransferase (adenine-specific)